MIALHALIDHLLLAYQELQFLLNVKLVNSQEMVLLVAALVQDNMLILLVLHILKIVLLVSILLILLEVLLVHVLIVLQANMLQALEHQFVVAVGLVTIFLKLGKQHGFKLLQVNMLIHIVLLLQ